MQNDIQYEGGNQDTSLGPQDGPQASSLAEGPETGIIGMGENSQVQNGSDNLFQQQQSRNQNSPDEISAQPEEQHLNTDDDYVLSQRDRLLLSQSYINQQVQTSNYSASVQGNDAGVPAQPGVVIQPMAVMNRFHWTQIMPIVYTVILLFMACLSGYFSYSGLIFFILFLIHSFAYYGFRASDDPIDMLSDKRKYNKSLFLREVFKWAFLAAAVIYLLVQLVGRAAKEFDEIKGMLQDADKEAATRDEYALDRELNHFISDFDSWWNMLRALLVLVASIALFKIQPEEEQESRTVSQACLNAHSDIHYRRENRNQSPVLSSQASQPTRNDLPVLSVNNVDGTDQSDILLTLGAHDNQMNEINRNNMENVIQRNGQQDINTLLSFKPYQVQKCVLIFKDYKMKAELFLVAQMIMLVLISNAQYCVYGLPYLTVVAIQLSIICYTHARSDQTIRVVSGYITIFLLIYLPCDLFGHYLVRREQDSLKSDDDVSAKYGQPRQNQQIEAYQGIMATMPSIVTFVLKLVLLIIECLKYKYSYDMAEVYDELKNTYRNAKNEEFPQSMRTGLPVKANGPGEHTVQLAQNQDEKGTSEKAQEDKQNEGEQTKKEDKDPGLINRFGQQFNPQFNQQANKDYNRRQRYNKLLKLQYIKIFRKSQSFPHRILQPISLFMLSLFQLVFILQHPSVIFIILLALILVGFFLSLNDVSAWRSHAIRSKVIFAIELLYVIVQYILNIYRFDGFSEAQRKEELTIVIGIGSEQQLGYYEDDVSIFDSLFPFNQSIVFLFAIVVFTRYMGKARIVRRTSRNVGGMAPDDDDGVPNARKSQASRSQYSAAEQLRGPGGLTDYSSDIRGAGYGAGTESDDGILTVYEHDTLSIQDFSDVRSQYSRRSSNIGGTRRGRTQQFDNDNQSQQNADLYQFIIQEEDDENDIDEENDIDMQDMKHPSDQKSLLSSSDNENRAATQTAYFNNTNQNATLQSPFYLRNMPRSVTQNAQGFEIRNRLGKKKSKEKKSRPDPTKDLTFRGKTRQWFLKTYISMLNFFDRVVDISIVHINKLVLLALFLVSVSRPNILNVVLFIMFLVLIMVPLHHEKGYLKLTIFMNSLAISIIYTLDVFIQRDYSAIRTWVLYIIGVQYRSENVQSHVIKLKYLPYVILQVILVLSIYVYESAKYKQFKSQYMDIETQKQMMIVKQLNKRHHALSESGTRSISQMSTSRRPNLRLPSSIGQISLAPAVPEQDNPSDSAYAPSIAASPIQADQNPINANNTSLDNSSVQREGGEMELNESEKDGLSREQEAKGSVSDDQIQDKVMPGSGQAEDERLEGGDSDEEDKLMERDEQNKEPKADDITEPEQARDMMGGDVEIDDKLTLPDEAKANLRKQQEMIVMYDPLSKFFIKNAAYFLIFFIFFEVVLLPLSLMNILLLILMTIIVVKMLYNETRLQQYRSLAITLQVLNIFVIIYIFTKYLFLFTEHTKNIQLKNQIENGYHQQSVVNDDGSIKHSDRSQEQQKTEDAKNQLHHSHDHDNENQSRQIQNKIIQKMFGFQTTEDQKNEGSSLLSFKLLNLAIVLSLTNLLLNILRHRNLAFLLGEKERVVKREFMQSNNYQSQNGTQGQDQSSEGSHYLFTLEADEKEEMIAHEKIHMSKRIKRFKEHWACWHYTKIYIGFIFQFLLPLTIILLTFIVYPMMTISVPSVLMVSITLILLALNATPDCWNSIHKSIGSLVQIMICVCYIIYFSLLDQMSSYDQSDQTERQQFQNMKVLWGVYDSQRIYDSQRTGQADDIASVLIPIIPLFAILIICFLQKELNKWFTQSFKVSVQVTDDISTEVMKYEKLRKQQEKQVVKEDQERVRREYTEGQEEGACRDPLDTQPKENKGPTVIGQLEAIQEEKDEGKKSEESLVDKKSEKKSSNGKQDGISNNTPEEVYSDTTMKKQKELKLFETVLESLKATDDETIAFHQGDGKVMKEVSNVFLKQMIEDFMEYRQRIESMPMQTTEINKEDSFSKLPLSVTSNRKPNENQVPKLTKRQEEQELLKQRREFLEEFIIDLLDYEAPYRHCFFLKNTIFLEYIANRNCVNIMVYFGVYSILNKMNLLGLLQWICLYLILRKNFKPNLFRDDESHQDTTSYTSEYNRKARPDSSKTQRIVFYVKLQLVLISILIIMQLSFSIYTNIQFTQQEEFQRSLSNSFCAGPSQTYEEEEYDDDGNIYQSASPLVSQNSFNKECAQDWSYYLFSMTAASQSDEESQRNIQENQNFVITSVIIDIFFLIATYQLFFVAKGNLRLSKQQKQSHPHINDENDFVSHQESKTQTKVKSSIKRFFQTTIFVYFPYFIIIMLMYMSATFNGHAISDLLSSIYLWFALKFIINIKKLFTKNSKILRPLRIYNRIVLTLILVYQMPLFLCPSAVDIQGYTDPDYITTEDCALIMHHQTTNPSRKQYEAKQPMQLYIILMHSIGLLKENQINMTFLFLFFLTEVQQQIFQNPNFREYVVKNMIIEKESDGKVRAFMYVERFHLTRLWANRAIKEEIKILHKILLRLNDQISKSDFAKNLAGFVEYQQKSIKSEGDSVQSNMIPDDDESKAFLNNDENQIAEEKSDKKSDKDIKSLDSDLQDKSKELSAYIELNSHIIDSIALENLRPDKPVIPLKIIVQELKILLEGELQSGKLERIEKLDEQLLTKYVNQLTKKLESYVYTKNRIDLYYKEGIGLAIALDDRDQDIEEQSYLYDDQFKDDGISKTSKTKSADQYLKSISQQTINRQILFERLYKSYTDSMNIEQQRKEMQRHDTETESKSLSTNQLPSSSAENSKLDQIQKSIVKQNQNPSSDPSSSSVSGSQSKSSVMSNIEQDFNPSPLSFEFTEEAEEEVMQGMTWSQKLNFQIRLFLWNNYVDHLLLIHLKKKDNDMFRLKRPKLKDYGIFRLIEASILSRSMPIVIIFIVFNFIMNANVISLFIVLTNLCYQVLENPLVSTRFWKFMMTYMLSVISLKFLYQLPIFCGTPVYTFYSDKCNNEEITAKELASRVDYIIGIHKFSGPASYPKNIGIFYGIFSDILLLMALLLHKQYLSKIGAWNYVKTESNIYKNPSFKLNERDVSTYGLDVRDQHEQLDLLANQHHQIFVYEQSAWYEKAWYGIKQFFYAISNFYGKVLPQYMDRRQKNLDCRKRNWQPYKTHKLQKVKPGQDYFTQTFMVLLTIQIYTLIYWRNISGEDKQQSFAAASVALDRFSTVQVVTLFLILLLLLLERMLYRARYHDERDNYGKYQSQPILQNNPVSGSPEVIQTNQTQKVKSRNTAAMRHTLTIKLFVHYSLFCLIHVYVGFYVPLYQLAPLSHNPWLVIYYIFWSYYFYYSALQIKYGYPMTPYKQTFSNDTSFLTFTAWRLYKAIPFIWEMKVIIDWTVTSTCLDLFQWFKLDDAYNTLYQNKEQSDDRKTRPEFQQRAAWEKVFKGLCFAIGIIIIILAPIFLFSGINPIMMHNPVRTGLLTIDLELISTGNSYRIFETHASSINPLSKTDDASWRLYFEPQSNQIDYSDMQKLQFNTYSETQWTISPPSLKKFITDFKSISKDKTKETEMVNFKAQWTFTRNQPMGKEKTEGTKVVALSKDDFLPVIEMLERDNQIQLPRIGVVQQTSTSKKDIKLAQLGVESEFEDDFNEFVDNDSDDDSMMVQTYDDIPYYMQENDEDQYHQFYPNQNTILAQQSSESHSNQGHKLKADQMPGMNMGQFSNNQNMAGPYGYPFNPYLYYQPPQQQQQQDFDDQQVEQPFSPYGSDQQQMQQPLFYASRSSEFQPIPQQQDQYQDPQSQPLPIIWPQTEQIDQIQGQGLIPSNQLSRIPNPENNTQINITALSITQSQQKIPQIATPTPPKKVDNFDKVQNTKQQAETANLNNTNPMKRIVKNIYSTNTQETKEHSQQKQDQLPQIEIVHQKAQKSEVKNTSQSQLLQKQPKINSNETQNKSQIQQKQANKEIKKEQILQLNQSKEAEKIKQNISKLTKNASLIHKDPQFVVKQNQEMQTSLKVAQNYNLNKQQNQIVDKQVDLKKNEQQNHQKLDKISTEEKSKKLIQQSTKNDMNLRNQYQEHPQHIIKFNEQPKKQQQNLDRQIYQPKNEIKSNKHDHPENLMKMQQLKHRSQIHQNQNSSFLKGITVEHLDTNSIKVKDKINNLSTHGIQNNLKQVIQQNNHHEVTSQKKREPQSFNATLKNRQLFNIQDNHKLVEQKIQSQSYPKQNASLNISNQQFQNKTAVPGQLIQHDTPIQSNQSMLRNRTNVTRRIWVEPPLQQKEKQNEQKLEPQIKPKSDQPPKSSENVQATPKNQSNLYEFNQDEEKNSGNMASGSSSRMYRNGKALISVKDAFPKLLHLSGKAETEDLPTTELQANTTRYSSMELVLNRQGNQIYYWTFSLGSSDGRGGKNASAYFRDTPGVFNSRNSQEEIESENRAERRKQSTSKLDKKLREKDRAEMQKKKVFDDQSLVILLYNEQVIGSFFGQALQLSVIGLYATIVITIGRFIRIIFDRISQRVMYEELPNTKQLFELCGGIFIAQQEGDLVREKQLYDLMILMYRSPEALIKITGTRIEFMEEESSSQASTMDGDSGSSKGSSYQSKSKKAA